MAAPSIELSTREERLDYVLNEWRCLHNCELCGKCHVLKGRSEEMLYAEYIEGKRSYMDITLENCYKADHGGSRFRRHRICQERCRHNGEDRLERREGREYQRSRLYRLPHDIGMSHQRENRRVSGRLLHRGVNLNLLTKRSVYAIVDSQRCQGQNHSCHTKSL